MKERTPYTRLSTTNEGRFCENIVTFENGNENDV